MRTKKIFLQIVAILLIIVGIARILASKSTFDLFGNKDLWFDNLLFQYLFKATGAFILFHGLIFMSISHDILRYKRLLGSYAFALFISGTAILLIGYLNYFPIWLYFSDAFICYALAAFCLYTKK